MSRSKFRFESGPSIQVTEDIVPVGEFKAHLAEKLRELKERRRPLIVTQNGRAAAVLLAPEEFDRLTSQSRFLSAIDAGLEDHDAGRMVGHEELGRRLDARFGTLRKKSK